MIRKLGLGHGHMLCVDDIFTFLSANSWFIYANQLLPNQKVPQRKFHECLNKSSVALPAYGTPASHKLHTVYTSTW